MMTFLHYLVLASVYGSGAYSSSTYDGTGGEGNALTNTGIVIGLVVGVAALILLIALVVRIWRRPSRNVPNDSADK